MNYVFNRIFKYHFYQALSHGGAIVHGRRAVYFYQPAIEILIDHDVITEKLELLSPLLIKHVLNTLQRVDDHIFYFFDKVGLPNIVPIFFLQVIL